MKCRSYKHTHMHEILVKLKASLHIVLYFNLVCRDNMFFHKPLHFHTGIFLYFFFVSGTLAKFDKSLEKQDISFKDLPSVKIFKCLHFINPYNSRDNVENKHITIYPIILFRWSTYKNAILYPCQLS